VRVIELFANRTQLPLLELPDRDPAPTIGRPDDRRVHQLEYGALAEGVRDDLRPTPFLQEEPLQQVRRPDDLAMAEREPEVSEARVEVLEETLHEGRQLALAGLNEVVAQQGGQRRRGRLVARAGADGDLEPLAVGCLAAEVAQPVDHIPLAHRAREARLGGADEPGRAVGDDQQGIRQASAFEVLEERRATGRVPLRARRQVQQHLLALLRDPQAQSTASRGIPACRRLATPSTKK
jgi:hypothetical protein